MDRSNKLIYFKNIDIYSILKDVASNWWVILLSACIGTMITYTVIRESYVPMYSSTAVYVVTPKSSSGYRSSDKQAAQNAANAFKGLLEQEIMQTRIKHDLKTTEWKASIGVEMLTETNLMNLTISSEDPLVAFKLIDYIMENYAELSQYLNEDAVFEELKPAEVATFPNNTLTPRNNSIIAGLIVAALMTLLIIIISIKRDTVKTEEAFDEILGTTLYGSVPHVNKNRTIKAKMQKKVKSILLTNPIVSFAFIEAINNIRVKIEYERHRHEKRNVFMVTSACENEGKSTTAINIALSLVREGKSVIVLDGDLRKPAMYKVLDIPEYKVQDYVDLLQGVASLEDVMYEDEATKLKLVMANKGHASTYEFVKSSAMRDLVNTLSDMADYVVVDTPPMALVSDAEAFADIVDYSLLVVRQDYGYQRDLNNSIDILNNGNSKFLGCIFNNYKALTSINSKTTYGRYGYDMEVHNE